MAANTVPIHTITPQSPAVAISTANTNRTDTGTITAICTAGANGTRIDAVRVQATGTTTAGVVRLWIHNGTANFLYKEILVSAITPSTTVEAWSAFFVPDAPIVLPTGYSLRASTHNAESFNCIVHGGDY